MDASAIPESARQELLTYLSATPADRARIIAEITKRDPTLADLLADLEADADLRGRFEIALLAAHDASGGSPDRWMG